MPEMPTRKELIMSVRAHLNEASQDLARAEAALLEEQTDKVEGLKKIIRDALDLVDTEIDSRVLAHCDQVPEHLEELHDILVRMEVL